MIKQCYIYHRNGGSRVVAYHDPDPSDPPEVQTMFARSPPVQSTALQVDPVNEFASYVTLDASAITTMFAAIDAARAAGP